MMKYYDLTQEMSMRMLRRWHIGIIRLPDGTEPILDGGMRLNDDLALRGTVTHAGHVVDFCFTSFGIPIATKAVADAVHSVSSADVQCIPISISGQSGRMVLNALRLIRCIDDERSEFIKWTKHDHRADLAGQYRQVTKLVLDRKAIPPDAHFFRIEHWEVVLVVSEVVKDAMERVGCYGAEFIELEMA